MYVLVKLAFLDVITDFFLLFLFIVIYNAICFIGKSVSSFDLLFLDILFHFPHNKVIIEMH